MKDILSQYELKWKGVNLEKIKYIKGTYFYWKE